MASRTNTTNLLTPAEKLKLSKISNGPNPHGQRAKALLALNEGSTQVTAGISAGLTRDQVKYWVAKFRASRMGIFPDTIVKEGKTTEDKPAKKVVTLTSVSKDAPPESLGDKKEGKKKKKKKKAKKDKTTAKAKSEGNKKKNKKSKKDKKNKMKGKKDKKVKKDKKGKKGKKGKKK